MLKYYRIKYPWLTISKIFSSFYRNKNIFTFYVKPSLKFSVDLVNFLISSPSTKVLPRFLLTDVLVTTFWHFLKKCDRKSTLGYNTTEFLGDISNFWKTCSIFLSIQMNFHTHRRFVWLFILNLNIFNCHAWQCLKVSAHLVDYKHIYFSCYTIPEIFWWFG